MKRSGYPMSSKLMFGRNRNLLGETKIQVLERRITALEAHIQDLEERYADLENRVNLAVEKFYQPESEG